MISKLDAAQREIEGAIRLHMSDEDPILILLSTFAAFKICRNINSAQKNRSFAELFGEAIAEARVKTGSFRRDDIYKQMDKAYNWLKHADSKKDDANIDIGLIQDQLSFWLLATVLEFGTTKRLLSMPMQIFKEGFFLNGGIGAERDVKHFILENEQWVDVIKRYRTR